MTLSLLYSCPGVSCLGLQHIKDMDLEQVQRRTIKMIRGLGHLSCEDRVRVSQHREENTPERPSSNLLRGKQAGERIFTKIYSDRTRGNCFKLKESRFRFIIRNHIFTERVGRHWNRMPGKLWMPRTWWSLRPCRMGLWATFSSERCPWLGQECSR